MSKFARYTDYNDTPYISENTIKPREEQRANQNTGEERGKEVKWRSGRRGGSPREGKCSLTEHAAYMGSAELQTGGSEV